MIENLKNKTLLYVEDEINVQTQYEIYFKNIFHEVYTALDGETALLLFKEKKPDALILDINIPKIDGITLAKIIRTRNLNTPIILLTARSDKETLKEAIELQLVTYLEKPVSREHLKNALVKLSKQFHDLNSIFLWESEKDIIYTWNKQTNQLFANNKNIKLTKKEILLLKLLIERNNVCSYQEIYEYVWEDSSKEYNESTIKTLISALKLKVPKDSIKNQYGMGYFI